MSVTQVLTTTQLRHRYAGERGEPIVFPDISLHAGSLLIVRGASGSGKSTLLHLLAGARRLDGTENGRIEVLGRDVSQLKVAQRDALRPATIGWIPQRVHLIQSLNVIDNIVLPIALANAGGSKRSLVESAHKLLARAGLGDLAQAKSTELSVGQAARCCVIRALVAEPKLLLADEPSAALDGASARAIAELIGEYCAAGGSAIVASHDNEFQIQLRSVCPNMTHDIELGRA